MSNETRIQSELIIQGSFDIDLLSELMGMSADKILNEGDVLPTGQIRTFSYWSIICETIAEREISVSLNTLMDRVNNINDDTKKYIFKNNLDLSIVCNVFSWDLNDPLFLIDIPLIKWLYRIEAEFAMDFYFY